MDFSQIIDSLKKLVKDEDVEKAVKLLGDLKAMHDDVQNDLSTANKESKERRLALKDAERKLNDALADKEAEIKKLTEKINDPAVQKEVETLKAEKAAFETKWAGILAERRKRLEEAISKLAENPKFEKAKTLLKLPKADKEGKLKFDTLSEEDVEHNTSKLTEWNELGYFAQEEKQHGFGDMKTDKVPEVDFTKIKNPSDMAAYMSQELKRKG